jgi:L-threonylcarbamoyladenylate synthase
MDTLIIQLDTEDFQTEDLDLAAEYLRTGRLVAFPTETVYGLGANALDAEAAKKIYEAKGRPSDNPLIVHIAEKKEIEKLAENIPALAYRLADVFWPGPLTMILKKKENCK